MNQDIDTARLRYLLSLAAPLPWEAAEGSPDQELIAETINALPRILDRLDQLEQLQG